jgi:hypothetical protein
MSSNALSCDFRQRRLSAGPTTACTAVSAAVSLLMERLINPRDQRALGVALDRVTPTDITLDAFEADFRLLNTGLAPIDAPVWPHLSDLQPSSELRPFSYLSLALEVRLSGTGPQQASGIGWVELYGSAERGDTIITLKPGE